MKIHEYQAKELLANYGVAVPRGHVAFTADEAVDAAERLGGKVWVVKAQIHAGGRGKGGGVKLARSIEEVRALADVLDPRAGIGVACSASAGELPGSRRAGKLCEVVPQIGGFAPRALERPRFGVRASVRSGEPTGEEGLLPAPWGSAREDGGGS